MRLLWRFLSATSLRLQLEINRPVSSSRASFVGTQPS